MTVFTICLLSLLYCARSGDDALLLSSSDPMFSTSVPFIGEYVGNSASPLTWSSPDCHQTQITKKIVEFVCPTHGRHLISVHDGQKEYTKEIQTDDSFMCYTWGMKYNSSTLAVNIWINGKDLEADSQLTEQFYFVGESPKVELQCDKERITLPRGTWDAGTWTINVNETIGTKFDNTRLHEDENILFDGENWKIRVEVDGTILLYDNETMRFEEEAQLWNISSVSGGTGGSEAMSMCTVVHITGVPALLDGCSVGHAMLPLYTKTIEAGVGNTPGSNVFKICTDYCGSGVTVLLNSSNVMISHNQLKDRLVLKLDGDAATVKDCGIIWGGVILLLVNDGNKLLVVDTNTEQGVFTHVELQLNFSADHISVNTKCVGYLELQQHSVSPAVLWGSDGVSLYSNGSLLDNVTELPDGMTKIEAVATTYLGTVAIMSNSSNYMWYDSFTNTKGVELPLDIDCGTGCRLFGICPHIFLLDDGGDLYFVTSNGLSINPLKSYETAQTLSSTVKSVAISSKDAWAILSEDKTLYYGSCARSRVVKIAEGLDTAEAIMFDSISDLYFVDGVGGRTPIPATVLLKNALQADSCQLRDFQTNLASSLKYLDKNETMQYTLQSSTLNYHQPNIIYQIYPQGHLTVNITSTVSPSEMVRGENRVSQDIQIRGSEKRGLTVIVATPEAAQPHCPTLHTDVTYVVVDCPPTRHIRVVDPRDTQDKQHAQNQLDTRRTCEALVAATLYRNATCDTPFLSCKDWESHNDTGYNVERFGCPIIWPHDQNYLPEVWIYDANEPIKQIESDFIVRELNNEKFGYTDRLKDVNCRRVPQSLEDLTAENYQNCFVKSDLNKGLNKTEKDLFYKIMNMSGGNSLDFTTKGARAWQKDGKGNYTFELTVLDPRLSFCKLQTTFAIWIIDGPPNSVVGIYVLIGACFVMVVILILSYLHYKTYILNKANIVLQS